MTIGEIENKKASRTVAQASAIIAIFPIIAPYTIISIPITWIISFLFLLHIAISERKIYIRICGKQLPLILFTLVNLAISANGFLLNYSSGSLFNSMISIVIGLLLMTQLWGHADFHHVIKYCKRVGIICCAYALFQLIMVILTGDAPNGKIELPFLETSFMWTSTTWGYRLNSIFPESSHFAIYLLPIFATSFLKREYKYAVVFAVAIILSSSSLGIIGLLLVLIWETVIGNETVINKIKRLSLVLAVMSLLALIIVNTPELLYFVRRAFMKIDSIDIGTDNMRLYGYFDYFFEYPTKEWLFGVGHAQFQNYMASKGVFVYNYSSALVLTFLQTGVLGFIALVAYMISLVRDSFRRKSTVFLLIFVVVFCVDSILFSDRYYYLLYFVLYFSEFIGASEKHDEDRHIIC